MKKVHEPEQPAKRDRIAVQLSYFIIGIAIGLLSLVTYWYFQPATVFEVKDNKLTPLQTTVQAGGEVPIKFSFCKKLDINGSVQRALISKQAEILTPSTADKIGKTCVNDVVSKVPVPGHIATGEYRVRYIGTYKINPIKTVREEYYSEPFIVVERDKGVQGFQGVQGVQGVQGIEGVPGEPGR